MTFLQMKYFQAVCQHGSITQAAAALYISQPAISAAIRELEKELSVRLFTKSGKFLQLTAEGSIFADLCNQVLAMLDNTTHVMLDLANRYKELRMGTTPMLASLYAPSLYRTFKEKFPENALHITEDEIQPLLKMLDNAELDMILMRDFGELSKKYNKLVIANLDFVFCVSPEHPLANETSVNALDIADEPLITFQQDILPYSIAEQFYKDSGQKANIAYRSNQISTIMGMIQSNNTCAFMYRAMQRQWPDLRYISLSPENKQEIAFYWRKDSFLFSGVQHLFACIDEMKQNPDFRDLYNI